jgi:hypothetical protein
MRRFKQLSKMFLASGALAASLSSCGDYRVYDVRVTVSDGISASSREAIFSCTMTISTSDQTILDSYPLSQDRGGCSAGVTKSNVGRFSYTTSRTSGTLTFQVDAQDNEGKNIYSGSASNIVSGTNPLEVDVTLDKCNTDKCKTPSQ